MRYRHNLIFYIPLVYSVCTRHSSWRKAFAFFLRYILPLLLLGYFSNDFLLWRFVLGVCLVYSAYEIGYIQNDTETIKCEKNPTLRLSHEQLAYYEANKVLIWIIRFVLVMMFSIISFFCGIRFEIILCPLLLIPMYLIYNNMRNQWNIHIYLFLVFLRYSVPIFVAINNLNFAVGIMIFALSPLPSYIERSVKGRFGYYNRFFQTYLISDYNYIHPFRVKYYLISLVIVLIIASVSSLSFDYFWVWLYQFLFALNSYLLIYKKFSCKKLLRSLIVKNNES